LGVDDNPLDGDDLTRGKPTLLDLKGRIAAWVSGRRLIAATRWLRARAR
jgi:hypothetical protein